MRGGYSVALVTTLKEVEGFVLADHARLCWVEVVMPMSFDVLVADVEVGVLSPTLFNSPQRVDLRRC